jgi:hypothetical protein
MPHPRFKAILDEMNRIHEAKDHDYAGEVPFSNFKKSEKFGIPAWKAVLIRMSDKWSRLESLSNTTGLVKDESFDDTLIDLANYAVICLILREEAKEKPLSVKEFIHIGDPRGKDGI